MSDEKIEGSVPRAVAEQAESIGRNSAQLREEVSALAAAVSGLTGCAMQWDWDEEMFVTMVRKVWSMQASGNIPIVRIR